MSKITINDVLGCDVICNQECGDSYPRRNYTVGVTSDGRAFFAEWLDHGIDGEELEGARALDTIAWEHVCREARWAVENLGMRAEDFSCQEFPFLRTGGCTYVFTKSGTLQFGGQGDDTWDETPCLSEIFGTGNLFS